MLIVSPLAFTVQLSIVFSAVLGCVIIVLLLYKRRISEGLFYLWALVFAGIFIVSISPRIQLFLTMMTGFESAVFVIFFFSLVLLIVTSIVYSVLISRMHSSIQDITSYVAQLRLDVDEAQRHSSEALAESDGVQNRQPEKGIQVASEIRGRRSAGGIL